MKVKKKADATTSTRRSNQQNETYPKTIPMSSPAIQIGQLLLLLAGNGQVDGWQQFEQLLHQFYEGRIL